MNAIKKIVILGGESTGKSTLCEQLAKAYDTVWVPEFARSYLEALGRNYVQQDLTEIAIGQLTLEEVLLVDANRFLFCDTDLHVIEVWSDFKYGTCDTFISDKIDTQVYDAYLITSPDFPWQEDPLRENPKPELRAYFFELYTERAKKSGLPFCIVKGTEAERLQQAMQFIETNFKQANKKINDDIVFKS